MPGSEERTDSVEVDVSEGAAAAGTCVGQSSREIHQSGSCCGRIKEAYSAHLSTMLGLELHPETIISVRLKTNERNRYALPADPQCRSEAPSSRPAICPPASGLIVSAPFSVQTKEQTNLFEHALDLCAGTSKIFSDAVPPGAQQKRLTSLVS